MRCLARNKIPFWFAQYTGKEPVTDEYGNRTGSWTVTYGNPQEWHANVSAAKGEAETRQFGDNLVYDRVIVLDGTAPAIDEYSILWVDVVPELEDDGSLSVNEDGEVITPHDYTVMKVAKSLNSVSIAINRVTVSG